MQKTGRPRNVTSNLVRSPSLGNLSSRTCTSQSTTTIHTMAELDTFTRDSRRMASRESSRVESI
jgi:hypothetical protein